MTLRRALLLLVVLGVPGHLAPGLAAEARAQVPPLFVIPEPPADPEDEVRGDTIPPAVADTVPPPAEQILPRNLPRGGHPVAPGSERGIWTWDREAILAHGAMTLHDLLSFVPGITMVRGGDIGAPVAVTWGGMGAGQIRVFLDGVEDLPLEGGVLDLAQVGLTGLEEVRIERSPHELRIHLESHRIEDARPLTTLEVATGDFRTNLFRVGFVHPDALGGTLLVALDRFDTDGPRRDEPGAVFGTRFRYTHFPRDGVGLALEYRSRTARRPEDTWEPREVGRSELSARLGWELSESMTAELHVLRASIKAGDRAAAGADTLLPGDVRSALGGRLTWRSGPVAAWGAGSFRSGEGGPRHVGEVGATAALDGVGGLAATAEFEGWSALAREGRGVDGEASEGGRSVGTQGAFSLKGWTAPLGPLSLFGEVGSGRRGLPFVLPAAPLPPEDGGENGEGNDGQNGEEAAPELRPVDPLVVAERTGVRAGARIGWQGAELSAAWVRVDADLLPPLRLPFDRRADVPAGGVRTGVEVEGRIPLDRVRRGLALSGTGQFWDDAPGWSYLPRRSWTGALAWHHTGYDGKLELWTDLGLRGRDPMPVPQAAAGGAEAVAPFTQSWFARVQVRVVTVRVFIQWENFTYRLDNADLPGRAQPQTRVMYGVRWTMWN
jgi:hypothetical protein